MSDNITKKCPECGCDKYVINYGLGNPDHRCCIECGQEWFVDVEYREDTELRAQITRLEAELRKADEAIVENHIVPQAITETGEYDCAFCGRDVYKEECDSDCPVTAARARLTPNSAERRED